jgi:lysophospholipase L1-like esterase
MQATSAKTYLALGDSYTIAESLPLYESFPYQTVQLLRKADQLFNAPEIIAKTGWTTDELLQQVETYSFQPPYDLITLLIGVNNQYRGRTIEEYAIQFERLLQKAIALSVNGNGNIVVLSIPDWSATPFAADHTNKDEIAAEINAFNSINKSIAHRYQTQYINITPGTREAATNESLLASDKLHPSAKAYAEWADQLFTMVSTIRLKSK